MTLVAALGLGLLIGLVIGALGGGGSILTVPVLVFALGLSAQEATTGSLVIVGVTAVVAAVSHARSGHTRWRLGLLLGATGVPASLLGTRLNRMVDENVLLLAFAVLMLVAATGMLIRSGDAEGDGQQAGGPTRRSMWLRVVAAGLLVGGLTGFFGVGGGFVVVPALVMALHLELAVAVGTSLVVIALNSAVALLARAGAGTFDWEVILPFTAAAVVASLGGERVAARLPGPALTRAFAVLLVLVAVYVAIRAGLGLA